MKEYELRLADGRTVVFFGHGGLNACYRYADAHEGATVVAWRDYPRHGVFAGTQNIVEGESR